MKLYEKYIIQSNNNKDLNDDDEINLDIHFNTFKFIILLFSTFVIFNQITQHGCYLCIIFLSKMK